MIMLGVNFMWCSICEFFNSTAFQGGSVVPGFSSLELVLVWRDEGKEVWQQMHTVEGSGSE